MAISSGPGDAARIGGGQKAQAAESEQDPQGRARKRKQHAFDHELLEQSPEPGADGGAHGNLPPARLGAREQQVGDVDAGDEQHEDDRAQQNQHGPPDVLHDLIAKTGHYDGMELGVEMVGAAAHGFADLLDIALHFAIGLGGRDSAFQFPEQRKVMAAAPAGAGGIQLEGHPEFGRVGCAGRKGEGRRHHPHHRARIAVHADVTPEHAAVAAEGPLPEPVGEDGGARNIRQVVGRGKETPEQRGDAEHGQHAAGDRGSLRPHRFAGAREIDALVDPGLERFPGCRVSLQFEVFGRRDPEMPQPPIGKGGEFGEHADQTARLGVWQGLQEHGVHHAENGGGGSDPQRQATCRGCREPWMGGQEPECVPHILNHVR